MTGPATTTGAVDPAVFRLAWSTPASWAPAVAAEPGRLLSDHAHLELKAAASAMTLLRRNVDRPGLDLALCGLVREETEHMHRVVRALHERGEPLLPDRPSPYAEGLHRVAADSRRGRETYLDALLVSALIEMRSHERFERLLECVAVADLHPLYRALGSAEERHGELFVELALQACDGALVAGRFAELAALEGEVAATAPFDYRIHAGPP